MSIDDNEQELLLHVHGDDQCIIDQDALLHIWYVLERLTVSFDRLGTFQLFHGEQVAKEALHEFVTPLLTHQISEARYLAAITLERCAPALIEQLEDADESLFGYWDGPVSSSSDKQGS